MTGYSAFVAWGCKVDDVNTPLQNNATGNDRVRMLSRTELNNAINNGIIKATGTPIPHYGNYGAETTDVYLLDIRHNSKPAPDVNKPYPITVKPFHPSLYATNPWIVIPALGHAAYGQWSGDTQTRVHYVGGAYFVENQSGMLLLDSKGAEISPQNWAYTSVFLNARPQR